MVLLSPPKQDDDDSPVYTRDGWKIPTARPEILSDLQMRGWSNDLLKNRRTGAAIRSYSLFPYNCVGMIFASRRKWIEIDYIYEILRRDGYRRISRNDCIVGDVVLYKQDNQATHIALIVQKWLIGSELNIKVLSKWGYLAEFEHFIDDIPIDHFGQATEYWTERQL